jgi:hypothetical protein
MKYVEEKVLCAGRMEPDLTAKAAEIAKEKSS